MLKNVSATIDAPVYKLINPNEERKKVLFVIDTLQVGGAEKSLLENISRFKVIRPVVCHLYKGEALKPRFLASQIKVYSVNISKKYAFWKACRELEKIVRQEQPDALVAYLTRSEIVSRIVGRRLGVPVIGTFVSDLYSRAYNQALSFRARKAVTFFKFINKITAGFCKGFIANSVAISKANAIQLGIPESKIKVISRGRDSKLFTFRNRSSETGRPIRFLNIGRLVPVKRQQDMVLAFKYFLQQRPDALLHIAGDGPCRESLSALIRNEHLENNVMLLGTRTDIPQLMQEYDCFIFPSSSEGFGGSVVEAMFAGLPVLASNIPVNKEILTHLETGYLFQNGSVEDMAKAMCWYKDHCVLAGKLALQAHNHAKEHFELEKIVAELEGYLHTIITEKN